jgi:preprotein translocase subunit SecD
MNWKNFKAPFKALVIVAVCAISLWAVIPVQKTIRLGLDLQGGARLLLQLYPTAEVPQITSQVQAQTREHQRTRCCRAVDQQRRHRSHSGRASSGEGSGSG